MPDTHERRELLNLGNDRIMGFLESSSTPTLALGVQSVSTRHSRVGVVNAWHLQRCRDWAPSAAQLDAIMPLSFCPEACRVLALTASLGL